MTITDFIIFIILPATIITLFITIFRLYRSLGDTRRNLEAANTEIAIRETKIEAAGAQIEELKKTIDTLTPFKTEAAATEALLQTTNAQLVQAKASIESLSPLAAENATLKEQIRLINEEKVKMEQENEARFKLLANEIFDDKTKRFKELNETRLAEILSPLKEQITKFETALHDNAKNDIKDREALRENIRQLMELNQTIGKEAKDLTTALKNNSKVQGDWGETILRSILENCGLQEGVEFTIQQTKDELGNTLRNDDGKTIRPDAVIKFPGNKALIIDSKVSLSNYIDYCSAEDDNERKEHIKKHILSVKRHIDELKGFKYQKAIANSADFIMMFIPNEGAYITAMQADNNLWKYAYDNHVVIISPTHLISVLKLVDQLWLHDKQNKNAEKIAEESGKLYDKFSGFITDMLGIKAHLDGTAKAYDDAMNKLTSGKGNLIGKAEKIKKLGAKTSKTLPVESCEDD